MNPRDCYIKTRRSATGATGEYLHHIHVDAQEMLPEATIEELYNAGLTTDLFDHDWQMYGKDGDPKKPFDHYEPLLHMTFCTSSRQAYQEKWREVVDSIERSQAKCYVEGELIIFDRALPTKLFDENAFQRIIRVMEEDTLFTYRSAIDQKSHLLPMQVALRRLDPHKNGIADSFRRGEVHLTFREDTDQRLLELLCNFGMSAPAIPKLVEAEDGTLERKPDGSFVVVRDIPLTLQTIDMWALMRVANLLTTLIENIGGVNEGSIKIELAPDFAVLNGVDYHRHVPPVMESVRFHPEFEHLDPNHLGSWSVNLKELTTEARHRAETAPHFGKTEQFAHIWEKTHKQT